MKKKMWTIYYLMLLSVSAGAQTTVTTSGATTGAIPVYTGSSTLGNSIITQSGSNIGIGTTSPSQALTIGGNGYFSSPWGDPSLFVGKGDAGVTKFNWGIVNTGTGALNRLAIGNSSDTGGLPGFSEIMSVVGNSMNVGIRMTAPVGPLDVGGVGGLIVSGANLDPSQDHAIAPLAALKSSGRLMLGWNRSGYGGDIDLISGGGGAGMGGFRFYDYTNAGVLNLLMAMPGNGNVGIGTENPGSTLEVNGNMKLTNGSGASLTFADGTVQSTAWTGSLCGGDYAEAVNASGDHKSYEPGDVLVLSDDNESDVTKSSQPYSTLVAGIYSTKPGLVGRRQTGEKTEAELPMAMVGIVPTKVSAENGSIHKGDLLVTSSTEGYAMKGTDRDRMLGAIAGKAMGALDSGTGVIEVLVSLQ